MHPSESIHSVALIKEGCFHFFGSLSPKHRENIAPENIKSDFSEHKFQGKDSHSAVCCLYGIYITKLQKKITIAVLHLY